MERPRRVGARFSGARLAADEFIQPQLAEDFDGKRDRWCGYDPNEHRAIVEEYHKVNMFVHCYFQNYIALQNEVEPTPFVAAI
jgi:hypothetical protein